MELLNYRKSGERFWNLLSMTPVRDRAGNLMSYIGVQSDITELIRRKEAEQELQARSTAKAAHEFVSVVRRSESSVMSERRGQCCLCSLTNSPV